MKRIYLFILSFLIFSIINGQIKKYPTDTISNKITLEEIVISASNFSEKKINVAQTIDVINSKTIAATNAQNSGDLLINTGKIFVQKSQQGGSSPILRGFEASRILLIIDGVRMNNAIYRSGHLQNIITADQNMLSRIEIMYGPSSTIYGSDALGGAIHFITKVPVLSTSNKCFSTGTSFVRYSSVNNEQTMHADISIGGKKLAWLQSYNFSNFGDMKMGNNYSDKYPNFGSRDSFIQSINNVDEIVYNEHPNIQYFSGYKQWDITQKILFKPTERIAHTINVQFSNTNNIPRYDRLQDIKNGRLRFAEWFYGPQKRLMAAYEFIAQKAWIFDDLKANINYQYIEESRQTREFRRYDRFDSRKERVAVFGAIISARKLMGNDELTIGFDMQTNDVKSSAFRKNLLTNTFTKLDTRYPDGKNTMNYFALFAQHIHKFSNKKLVLNDGIRLQLVHLNSNIIDNSFFNLPDTAVTQKNLAITGNVGLVYSASKNTILKVTLASGFRAPNIDDLAKIFESNTAARQVVIPNKNLSPEYTYNVDISVQQKISDKVNIDFTSFYTKFSNAIVKAAFNLDGKDSILYNGIHSQVLASQNANKANLYGFTAGVNATVLKAFTVEGTISYIHGRFITSPTTASSIYEKQPNGAYLLTKRNVSSIPLDHIPPVIGKASICYQHNKFNISVAAIYNGWKHLNQMSTSGEDNPQYATQDGFPSWVILNLRFNYQVSKTIVIQTGIENIFDKNYRYFSSGFSAGGRNLFISVRANW